MLNGFRYSSRELKTARSRLFGIFFFKQKTAYEIYRCDWSSDVSLPIWRIPVIPPAWVSVVRI